MTASFSAFLPELPARPAGDLRYYDFGRACQVLSFRLAALDPATWDREIAAFEELVADALDDQWLRALTDEIRPVNRSGVTLPPTARDALIEAMIRWVPRAELRSPLGLKQMLEVALVAMLERSASGRHWATARRLLLALDEHPRLTVSFRSELPRGHLNFLYNISGKLLPISVEGTGAFWLQFRRPCAPANPTAFALVLEARKRRIISTNITGVTALLTAPDLPVEELAPTLWHLTECMGALNRATDGDWLAEGPTLLTDLPQALAEPLTRIPWREYLRILRRLLRDDLVVAAQLVTVSPGARLADIAPEELAPCLDEEVPVAVREGVIGRLAECMGSET